MIKSLLTRCLTVFLSITVLSACAFAQDVYSNDYKGSICESRNLYIMNPGNLKAQLEIGNPFNENRYYLNSGDLTLHRLTREGDTETIRSLLEAGLDPNPVNDFGLTALSVAAAMNQADIVTLLLDAGADPNWTAELEHYPCRTTPLHWAAYLNHTDVVAALLNAGADTNAPTKTGNTPVDWANFGGQVDALLLMLKAGKASDSGQGSKKIVAPE